jgi:hypothetical protein
MDESLSAADPGENTRLALAAIQQRGIVPSELGIGRRHAARANHTELLPVGDTHHADRRAAQMHRLFQHRIEHRREVARRRIDNLQDLRGRGLLFQRLARLGHQPRVLHRDDRLRREAFQERNLLFREWPNLLAVNGDCAEENVVFAQRHDQAGTNTANLDLLLKFRRRVRALLEGIGKVDDRFAAGQSP